MLYLFVAEAVKMSNRTLNVNDRLYAYLQAHTLRETELLRRLREETAGMGGIARMQIAPEQGQFMALLVELLGARQILEVGTFTGYSALACAAALPPDGRLVACDLSEEWTAVGRRYWEEAGVADKIELRLGPAKETLNRLLEEGQANRFDMMFIDADKLGYDAYYELGLRLVRPGGLILIDNVLWGGSVADSADNDPDTVAIRRLNDKIQHDNRVTMSLLPVGDGLTLARRRI
jgi:predicted O-methyltransferase YrrM